MRQAGVMTDQVDGGLMGKFEPGISRTGGAIAFQFTISTNSRTQDPMPTITPVAYQSIPEVSSCARKR